MRKVSKSPTCILIKAANKFRGRRKSQNPDDGDFYCYQNAIVIGMRFSMMLLLLEYLQRALPLQPPQPLASLLALPVDIRPALP